MGVLVICLFVFTVFCIFCTVFFVLFLLRIFILVCFVFISVRTTCHRVTNQLQLLVEVEIIIIIIIIYVPCLFIKFAMSAMYKHFAIAPYV